MLTDCKSGNCVLADGHTGDHVPHSPPEISDPEISDAENAAYLDEQRRTLEVFRLRLEILALSENVGGFDTKALRKLIQFNLDAFVDPEQGQTAPLYVIARAQTKACEKFACNLLVGGNEEHASLVTQKECVKHHCQICNRPGYMHEHFAIPKNP